jgi:threonyl-tRNA synthetase
MENIQNNSNNLESIRHSLAHVMAVAVLELYPATKVAIGPAIDDGFYYDFDFLAEKPTEKEFDKIETKMRELINKGLDFVRSEIDEKEAKKLFKDEPFKLKILDSIFEKDKDVTLSIYTLGNFVDLCKGPHINDTKELKSCGFKLRAINGAYFQGNEKNKMLTRIYAYAFDSKEKLKEHLVMVEEAAKRDHNKVGRELEIFTTVEEIGQGLPIMLPNGAKILQTLQRFVEDEEEKRGYQLTKTPYMAKSALYKISGHWQHYRDDMFVFGDDDKGEGAFALRPMTCPFQYQVFLNRVRSYRDLPMRLGETSVMFRNEDSGGMHGLVRVRQFTLSDGHIMCTEEQIKQEVKGCLELNLFMLKTLGIQGDVSYRLSTWDENNKEKYEGSADEWENTTNILKEILEELKVPYYIGVGEAAFYGPKVDIQIKNVNGKEDTLLTVQLDKLLAKSYGMEFTDKDGIKKNPVIIHRSSIGCYERTLAFLIEKYAGEMPFWLCPTQIGVVPVNENFNDYASKICDELRKVGIRASVNLDDMNMGKKVNELRKQKVPFTLVLGEAEQKAKTVSVKIRGGEQKNDIKLADFIKQVTKLKEDKSLELKLK